MAVWQALKNGLLGVKSIDKVGTNELKTEKIRLDQREAKYLREVDTLEKQKKQLFQEGIKESSQLKQLVLARKIAQHDTEARTVSARLRDIGHQVRIVNGLIMIKDEMSLMAKDAKNLISKLSLDELATYVDRSTVKGEFQRERLKEIVATVEGGNPLISDPLAAEEEEVQRIVAIMQRTSPLAMTDAVKATEQGLKQVNDVLSQRTPITDVE